MFTFLHIFGSGAVHDEMFKAANGKTMEQMDYVKFKPTIDLNTVLNNLYSIMQLPQSAHKIARRTALEPTV